MTGEQIGANRYWENGEAIARAETEWTVGDSFEYANDFGAMGFRLRRARRVIPKGVKLRRKHRSDRAVRGSSPSWNFLYKSCYYKGEAFYARKLDAAGVSPS